jgi:hypothetical protein
MLERERGEQWGIGMRGLKLYSIGRNQGRFALIIHMQKKVETSSAMNSHYEISLDSIKYHELSAFPSLHTVTN